MVVRFYLFTTIVIDFNRITTIIIIVIKKSIHVPAVVFTAYVRSWNSMSTDGRFALCVRVFISILLGILIIGLDLETLKTLGLDEHTSGIASSVSSSLSLPPLPPSFLAIVSNGSEFLTRTVAVAIFSASSSDVRTTIIIMFPYDFFDKNCARNPFFYSSLLYKHDHICTIFNNKKIVEWNRYPLTGSDLVQHRSAHLPQSVRLNEPVCCQSTGVRCNNCCCPSAPLRSLLYFSMTMFVMMVFVMRRFTITTTMGK